MAQEISFEQKVTGEVKAHLGQLTYNNLVLSSHVEDLEAALETANARIKALQGDHDAPVEGAIVN